MPPGLNLFWDQCYSGGGTIRKTFACNTNLGGVFQMYASVVIPQDMPQFAAATMTVNATVSSGTLPPWWQTDTGQCRAGAISVSLDPTLLSLSGCADIWNGFPNYQVFQLQQGPNGSGTFRLSAGAAVPAGSELALVADGTELVVARIIITRQKTVGTGSCAGCVNVACFWYSETILRQAAGLGDYTVTNWSTSGYTEFIGGASGSGFPCEVPALNRTWGAIKTLYR